MAAYFARLSESWGHFWQQVAVSPSSPLAPEPDLIKSQQLVIKQLADEQLTDEEKKRLVDLTNQNAKTARNYHKLFIAWLHKTLVTDASKNSAVHQQHLFWLAQIANALAPENFFWTNPMVMRRFIQSKGASLLNGYTQWFEDYRTGADTVRMTDQEAFKVGHNIATTPGRVVYRNALMELIQYEPSTAVTHRLPVVLIQPWINKYYIFDLNETKSLVRFLRDSGFTVFITSWKNPDSGMHHIGFDDYLKMGALQAVKVAQTICNVARVHAAGYCIGGTLLAGLLAWLNGNGGSGNTSPVAHASLFSTMVDYSEPGELGVYINEATLRYVEEMMHIDGYLDGRYIALAFRLLRSNSLIWRNYVHAYLMGNKAPRSEVLYWNSDSTRLPEKMCRFYLREFYFNNKLAQTDALTLAGRPIALNRIKQPLYAVGALQDHICPWPATFKIRRHAKGPVRYVLTTEGHITGFVNPPSERSKMKYWVNGRRSKATPQNWLTQQTARKGSWWQDWREWLSKKCGPKIAPPPMGHQRYPAQEPAPGVYVLEP